MIWPVRRRVRKRYPGYDVEVRDLGTGEVTTQRVDMDMLKMYPDNLRVIVPFNAVGQPIENGGNLYNKFLNYIGHNYQIFRIDEEDWTAFRQEYKQKVFVEQVMRRFDVDPIRGHDAAKKMCEAWKNHRLVLYRARDPLMNRPTEEVDALVPAGVPKEQWRAYVRLRRGPRARELSIRNQANVAQQTNRHTSGATTYAVRLSSMVREDQAEGREPTNLVELYRVTHMRVDGTWSSKDAPRIYEEMLKVREEQLATQQEAGGEVDPLLPYRRTLGQREHTGRVRGLGYGPTPSQVWGKGYSSTGEGSSSQSRRRKSDVDTDELRT